MNCSEAEQLFDAHLDGQLTGSLRLELDAHRLRCRRCQQTLAMMEACEHVLAADRRVPALAEDFTERVMSDAVQRRRIPGRLRSTRIAVAVGFGLQAAAVLILAIIIQSKPGQPVNESAVVGPAGPAEVVLVKDAASNDGVGFSELLGGPRSAGATFLAAFIAPVSEIKHAVVGWTNITNLPPMLEPSGREESAPPSTRSDQYSL
ncbi:MAG TPA: hypothetical protein VM487_08665 [Phycisphaerae bacterium]|nr:hypothetical protein [Phycisphaerae bacterium]